MVKVNEILSALVPLVATAMAAPAPQFDMGNMGGFDMGAMGGMPMGGFDMGNFGGMPMGGFDMGAMGGMPMGGFDMGAMGGMPMGGFDMGAMGGMMGGFPMSADGNTEVPETVPEEPKEEEPTAEAN